MVLGQFQTTYRQDYLWPYVRAYGIQPAEQGGGGETAEDFCKCNCPRLERTPAETATEIAWSRLGPMGPLLDPKIYPAKVSAPIESDISRFNQPNVYLEKLKEKYPYIYECLKNAPPDDMISRINRDRLRTTYQVDYCHLEEYPSAPYDELLRAAGVAGVGPCPEPVQLPGDPCRPNRKSIAFRTTAISNIVGGGKCNKSGGGGGGGGRDGGASGDVGRDDAANKYCVGSCKGPFGSMTAGATEYQDAISRLGQMILRDRVHHKMAKKKK